MAVVVLTWTAPIPCWADGYARVPRRSAAAKSSRSGSPTSGNTASPPPIGINEKEDRRERVTHSAAASYEKSAAGADPSARLRS